MLNHKQQTCALLILSIFLTASCIFPIRFHPYRTFYQDGLAIFGVLLTLSYMACTAYGGSKVTLRIPNTIIVPVTLIVVIAVQTWNGFILYPIDMLFPVIYLICLALALICGATLAMQENGLERLGIYFACTFIGIGLLSVLFQQVQLINLNWTPFVNPILFDKSPRPYANVAQPNLLALILCFSVLSVWYIYLKQRIKPGVAITMVVFLLWGLALTQSRIVWIILPLYVVLCWRQPANTTKVSKPLLPIFLVVFACFVFCLPHLLTALGVVNESVQDRAAQTSVRLVLWEQAWTMSAMHPWFGVGWFQFGPQQIILSSLFRPSEYSEYAHNILLNFAAEIGWPLTILLCAGTLYWFYSCCMRRWKDAQVRFVSLMLLAIAVHSMVEFPLWHGFVLMPFGVMIGALHTERVGWETMNIARGWIIAFVTASLFMMGAITWDYVRVARGFDALMWTQEGKKTGVGSIEKPEFTLFPQFYDYFRIIKIKIYPGMPKEDIQFLERIALRFGFMPVLSRTALAFAYNQRPTEALQVLITIERTSPSVYGKVYADWLLNAKNDPVVFGEIVKRMPTPES